MYKDAFVAGLKVVKAQPVAEPALDLENEIDEGNRLFNQAVQEGWNREMDWLWLATKVSLPSQRYFCLEQALRINPESEMAKQALKKFKGKPAGR